MPFYQKLLRIKKRSVLKKFYAFCRFLIILSLKLFGIGKFNGIEKITFFGDFKGFNKLFCLKVLEKFDESFASIHFCVVAGVFDAAFGENVVKGQRGSEFVSFDFNDTVNGVVFKFNIHLCVLLVRHIEKFSGEG